MRARRHWCTKQNMDAIYRRRCRHNRAPTAASVVYKMYKMRALCRRCGHGHGRCWCRCDGARFVLGDGAAGGAARLEVARTHRAPGRRHHGAIRWGGLLLLLGFRIDGVLLQLAAFSCDTKNRRMENVWLAGNLRRSYHGIWAHLTGHAQHDGAPPDRPAPADQTEQQTEHLRHADNAVDDERSETGTGAVVLRETRHADAQTEEAGQDGAFERWRVLLVTTKNRTSYISYIFLY